MQSLMPNNNQLTLSILVIALLLIVSISYHSLDRLSAIALEDGEYLSIESAQMLPTNIPVFEIENGRNNWIDVTFPFHWRNQLTDTRAVWYKFNVTKDQIDALLHQGSQENLWAIYLWRLNQTADFWLNGEKIGSGGNTTEPMARYWNTPLYVEFSDALLKENNLFLVKHYSQHNWGSIETLILGPSDQLKTVYDNRYFVQHDIALGLFVFVIVTGLFSATVWFYRRQELQYIWFAIASAGLSLYCLNQFIRYLPVGPDTWRWLSNIATDLWACALLLCVLRTLQLRKPRAEIISVAYFLSGIPIYYIASFQGLFDINIYYHIGSLSIGVYLLIVCIKQYRNTQQVLAAFYACVITLVFIAGVHDTLMQAIVNNGWQGGLSSAFENHFNSVHFAAPIVFLMIGMSLVKGFTDSMNAVDRLNNELEKRINDAKQELANNYKAIEKVLIKQSASEERERIYRDLHDDVGSKLLSLFYRLEKKSDSMLAKSALEDLRDIVSRKSLGSCLLTVAVRQWKKEISERLDDANITLLWTDSVSNDAIELTELQHTHLRRMLREVLSNAILHSQTQHEIQVKIQTNNHELFISVINDGAPKPVSDWKVGRGISNLRVRARDLKGDLEIIDMEGSWVKIFWKIPIQSAQGGYL